MPITIGAAKLKKCSIGTTPVKKVFIGNDLVWSDNPDNVVFIAGGNFYTSNDGGATWIASNPFTSSPKAVSYYDEYVSASSTLTSDTSVGNIEYATSDDGINWTVRTVLTGKYKLAVNCIKKYENYVWIGISYSNSSGSGTSSGVLRSTDGGKTFPDIIYMGGSVASLEFGNGVLVGVTGNTYRVYYSTDYGTTWTQTQAGTSYVYHRELYFDGVQFIMRGQHTDTGDYSIRVSVDGASWTNKSLASTSHSFFNKSGGYYTSGATSYIGYSTDLSAWTTVLVKSNYRVAGVVYTGKKFIASVYLGSSGNEVYNSTVITSSFVKVSTTVSMSSNTMIYSDPMLSYQS